MRFLAAALLLVCTCLPASAQEPAPKPGGRPKLVVGIMVDQMRWDYLQRFQHQFGENGFKRLMREGFSCDSTFINHLPSATAVGHATVFTGTVPAFHGITGNDWIEQATGTKLYCVEDQTVNPVGTENKFGRVSPRNLLATTMTDELRLATNFRSKVVGVSIKDRAAVLPAGHSANGVYWFEDEAGGFITSTYYMPELPKWVVDFNAANVGGELVKDEWPLALDPKTYIQSSGDDVPWEGKLGKEKAPVFPHAISAAYRIDRSIIRTTPFGNSLTMRFAVAAIAGHALGDDDDTDFLTINFASTDYIGHKFGPNSIEVEDTYVRLDRDLGAFFEILDTMVGKGQYLVFLAADHAVAHNIGFMQASKLPADYFDQGAVLTPLNELLKQQTGAEKLVLSFTNGTVNFDIKKIEGGSLDFEKIKAATIAFLRRQPGVLFAVDTARLGESPVPARLKTMISHGYHAPRCGDIQVVLKSGWMAIGKTGTTHGAWNPYDTHIPLLFMGWGIPHGATARVVHMQDIAPTVCSLLRIQMPSACIGEPILEVLGQGR